MLPVGTNDTLVILKYQLLKKLSRIFRQRYHDKLEEHSDNLAVKLVKARGIVRRLERKRPTDPLN